MAAGNSAQVTSLHLVVGGARRTGTVCRESLVEELSAHTEEHQLTLSATPESVSKSDQVTKGGRDECTGLQEDILHGGLDEATLSQESSLRDSRKALAGRFYTNPILRETGSTRTQELGNGVYVRPE